MATVSLIEYENATPEVRAVFDDIKRTRNVKDVNNFWKALANHPATLKRTWESLREVMQPGALDPLTKEMLYVAVSVANNCDYCIQLAHRVRVRERDDPGTVRGVVGGCRHGKRNQRAGDRDEGAGG